MNDPNQFAARYVAAWNEPDPNLRSKAIAEIFTDRARYHNVRTAYQGLDAIESAVKASHERWVRQGYIFRACGDAVSHHGGMRFTWDMMPAAGGEVTSIGTEFVLLGEDNRILYDYQFIDK